MNLAEAFTNNYEYLHTVARRITRKKDINRAGDLLSTTYIELFERQQSGKLETIRDFVKFFCKAMKNYHDWPNSEFNKMFNPKERLTIDQPTTSLNSHKTSNTANGFTVTGGHPNKYIELIIDENALKEIEIQTEGTNDFTKELIEISSNLGKEKTLKYIELVEFKRTLPSHEAILFELYFEKQMSTREIATEYSMGPNKINYQSINKMINIIKQKIETREWKR